MASSICGARRIPKQRRGPEGPLQFWRKGELHEYRLPTGLVVPKTRALRTVLLWSDLLYLPRPNGTVLYLNQTNERPQPQY